MKFLKASLLGTLLCTSIAHADVSDYLYASAQVATILDWSQTIHISQNPDKYTELNPILGENPSKGRVNNFMIARLAINHAVYKYTSDEYKPYVLAGLNIAYWGAVYHNNSIGVKFEEQDKLKHFFVSSALGVAAKSYTNSNSKAIALALVPGVIKELYDSKSSSGSGWSNKDMIANLAGAVSGIYFKDVFVKKDNHQIVIGISKEF